jgi:hypothetical protein
MKESHKWIIGQVLDAIGKGKRLSSEARISAAREPGSAKTIELSVESDRQLDDAIEGLRAILNDDE